MKNIPIKIWACYLNAMHFVQRWLRSNRRLSALTLSQGLDLQLKYRAVGLEKQEKHS